MNKDCSNCYWFDKCHHYEVCDDYDPIDEEVKDEMATEEYRQELYKREKAYQIIIDEQEK